MAPRPRRLRRPRNRLPALEPRGDARFLFKGLVVAAFILLHMLDGREIYVRVEEIIAISEPRPGMKAPGTGANILLHDQWFAIRESPKQIVELARE